MSESTSRVVEEGPMLAQVQSDNGVTGARARKEAQRIKDANPVKVKRVEDKQPESAEQSEAPAASGVMGFLKGWNSED